MRTTTLALACLLASAARADVLYQSHDFNAHRDAESAVYPMALNNYGQVAAVGREGVLLFDHEEGNYFLDADSDGVNDLVTVLADPETEYPNAAVGIPEVLLSDVGGVAFTVSTNPGGYFGFTIEGGRRRMLGLLGGGGGSMSFAAMNNRNEVVGTSSNGNCAGGTLWALGKALALGHLCQDPCRCNNYGRAITNRGRVAAMSYGWDEGQQFYLNHAYLWDGSITVIPRPFGARPGRMVPNAMNESEQVVGFIEDYDVSYSARAFVSWRGTTIELPVFPNSRGCAAYDINNLGEIVGDCSVDEEGTTDPDVDIPFLYLGEPNYGLSEGLHDLRAVTGLDFDQARFINDSGQILTNRWRDAARFLLTPLGVTPPSRRGTAGDHPDGGVDGDPVSTLTGELLLDPIVDLDLGGPLALRFERSYASARDLEDPPGPLGRNWRHGYEWELSRTGDVATVTSPAGARLRFAKQGLAWIGASSAQLMEDGGAFVFFDPAEERFRRFDAGGRLASIADRNGNTLLLDATTDGRLVAVRDGRGRRLGFGYGADGLLDAVSDGVRAVRFGHEGGDLSRAIDVRGDATLYGYVQDAALPALLESWTRPAGNVPSVQSYDPAGRVRRQTDAMSEVVTLHWGDAGSTVVTDALGSTTAHVHQGGRLVKVEDALASPARVGYDAQGRRASVTNRMGGTTTFGYHAPSGLIATITYPDQSVLAHGYASLEVDGAQVWRIARTVHQDGSTSTREHDARGNVTRLVDRVGHAWTLERNAAGQIAALGNPDGGTSTFTFHADGTLATTRGADGSTVSYGYDALRRRESITLPGGAVLRATYDDAGRLLSATDALGGVDRYEYDPNGNLAVLTGRDGQVRRMMYDALDRLVTLARPRGGRHLWLYDAAGRVSEVIEPSGARHVMERDARGLVTRYLDPAGQAWSYAHDAEGRTTRATTPLGAAVSYTWDAMGRLSRIDPPAGPPVRFTWDVGGRLTRMEDGQGVHLYEHDAEGRLLAQTLPGGATVRVQLDGLGLATAITDPNRNVWRIERDRLGRPVAKIDPLGRRTEYAWNARGLLGEVAFPDGARVVFEHDLGGRLVRRAFSGGGELRTQYDAAGRIVAAANAALAYDADGGVMGSNGLALERDEAGRLMKVRYAAGREVLYDYDGAGRLARLRDWIGGETRFTWDAAGRLERVERPNGVRTTWAYDLVDRLTSVREEGAFGVSHSALERDDAGNVLRATRSVPLAAGLDEAQSAAINAERSYDAAHQEQGLPHDALGRITSARGRSYTWDGASRLLRISAPDVELTHDGFGLLVARREGGALARYVWNHGLALPSIAVELEGGEDLAYYVHMPDGTLVYAIDARSGARRWHHFDERGSTIFRTGDAGEVAAAWAYAPYGAVLRHTGEAHNPFTFMGRFGVVQDGGLYHARQRVYDSVSGRFLSRDPREAFLHPAKINPYAFAGGNPLRFVDYSGAEAQDTLYAGTTAESVADKSLKTTALVMWALQQVGDRMQNVSKEQISIISEQLIGGRYWSDELSAKLKEAQKSGAFGADLSRAADKFGKAGDALALLNEVAKFVDKAEAAARERKRDLEATVESYAHLNDEIQELMKKKAISYPAAVAWQQELQGIEREVVDAIQDNFHLTTAIESLTLFKEALKTLVGQCDKIPSQIQPLVGAALP